MVLAAQIKFFFILGHQSKSCIFVVHSALLAHIYVIENKCKHAIKFNCKCKTSLSLKFYDPQMAMFDVQQVQWHHFSFQAGVNRNYIVLEKQVHKDVRKKKNVENIRQIGKNHETGKRCDGAGDRANSPPFWAFSLHVRAVIQDEPWKRCPLLIIFFFFFIFFITSVFFCPHWQKGTKTGSENHAFHWATTMGREPYTVGHCMYAKEGENAAARRKCSLCSAL